MMAIINPKLTSKICSFLMVFCGIEISVIIEQKKQILYLKPLTEYQTIMQYKNTKSDSGLSPESPLVEKRRLERPTPTSRTWCATNCATSRCFSINLQICKFENDHAGSNNFQIFKFLIFNFFLKSRCKGTVFF